MRALHLSLLLSEDLIYRRPCCSANNRLPTGQLQLFGSLGVGVPLLGLLARAPLSPRRGSVLTLPLSFSALFRPLNWLLWLLPRLRQRDLPYQLQVVPGGMEFRLANWGELGLPLKVDLFGRRLPVIFRVTSDFLFFTALGLFFL